MTAQCLREVVLILIYSHDAVLRQVVGRPYLLQVVTVGVANSGEAYSRECVAKCRARFRNAAFLPCASAPEGHGKRVIHKAKFINRGIRDLTRHRGRAQIAAEWDVANEATRLRAD